MSFEIYQNQPSFDLDFFQEILNMESHPNYKPMPPINIDLMQGKLFTLLKTHFDIISFQSFRVLDSCAKIHIVKTIYDAFIEDVLLEIKGPEMRFSLLMMLLNEVDLRRVELLRKRKKVSKGVTNYLKIIDNFSVDSINYTKGLLRQAILEMLSDSWIFQKAHSTSFRENERDSRFVFEEYLLNFRKQLRRQKIGKPSEMQMD